MERHGYCLPKVAEAHTWKNKGRRREWTGFWGRRRIRITKRGERIETPAKKVRDESRNCSEKRLRFVIKRITDQLMKKNDVEEQKNGKMRRVR